MFTNPITINTFVVFVRLYWFEKRFQNIVHEARTLRRTRSRSFSRAEMRQDRDLERGVRGRPIVVQLTQSGQALGHSLETDTVDQAPANGNANANGNGKGKVREPDSEFPPFHRDIVFADEVKKDEEEIDRLPERWTKEQHIAFVENQRAQDRGRTLRIPGPREFDAGEVPQQIDENEEGGELHRKPSTFIDETADGNANRLNMDDHPVKDSSEEAEHAGSRFARSLAHLHIGRTGSKSVREPSVTGSLRNRLGSRGIGGILTSHTQEKEERDPMPYLSYAATVGRNSTFVDLTEEQRDELGGIEYRALKTLAVVLMGMKLLALKRTGR